MSNIIHYLFVLICTYPVKKRIILILKYYSDDITHKVKITYLIAVYMSHTGNDACVVAATHGDSQCCS